MGLTRRRVAQKVAEIEAELLRIGWWDIPEPAPEAFTSERAFFMDAMAFPQWLRFVFLPTVRRMLDQNEDLPASSSIGAQAVREFDGQDDARQLTRLLSELDGIIEDAPIDELLGGAA